jgi:hypothetical protein
MRGNRFLNAALVAVAVLAMAGLALGQAQSGNIYGKLVAEDGSALPGVTVTLTGGGPTLVSATDSRGDFHFLTLSGAPGPAGVRDRRPLYTTKSSLRSIPLNKEVD